MCKLGDAINDADGQCITRPSNWPRAWFLGSWPNVFRWADPEWNSASVWFQPFLFNPKILGRKKGICAQKVVVLHPSGGVQKRMKTILQPKPHIRFPSNLVLVSFNNRWTHPGSLKEILGGNKKLCHSTSKFRGVNRVCADHMHQTQLTSSLHL